MNGYICDSCAVQAYEITQEALDANKRRWQPHETESERTCLNLIEIKNFLDQYVIGQDDAKRYPVGICVQSL